MKRLAAEQKGGSMGKRSVVLGAAVALVALAVGAIGPAWGASSDKDRQRTFTLEALTTEQEFEGTALGDQIVFTTQLLKGDTEVGHQGGCAPSPQLCAPWRSAWPRTCGPAGISPARP